MNTLNENNLTEQSLIEWLQGQGYEYVYGPDINPGQPRAEREDLSVEITIIFPTPKIL